MILPSIPFLLAAVLLAITPGPGIAYVVARTVAGGRGEGVASCFGTGLGGLVHVLAGALGLSLLIAQSAVAFSFVKYLGAAYLIFLGVRLLASRGTGDALPKLPRAGARKAFREGVLVEALNVKTAMFFLAFIPQFVHTDAPVATQFILLGTICVALNTGVDLLAVFAASRFLRSGVARSARARWLQRASGTTMIGLGLYVALAKRD